MVSTCVPGGDPGASVVRALRLCVIEARPAVLAVSMLRFVTGAVLALPVATTADPVRVALGATAWVLSIFAVYLANGITDVTEDQANGSARPIARGDLDPHSARLAVIGAGLLALALTTCLPMVLTWIVAANLLLGYLYSGAPFRLKSRSGGTVAVICASGLLAYAGGFAVVTDGRPAGAPVALVVFALASAYWMTLVGVPAKDLSDVDGDAVAGRKTIAVTRGVRTSGRLMSAAALVLAVTFVIAAVMVGSPLIMASAAMGAGAVAITVVGNRYAARESRSERRRSYQVFMATQHLVHITALVSAI